MVTAAASGSTTGGDDANSEKIMQASTTIAPSRHTAAYDFKKTSSDILARLSCEGR